MQRHTGCRFPLVPAIKPGPPEEPTETAAAQGDARIEAAPLPDASPERKPGSTD
ncbi:MAG: hypothetical protein Q8M26_10690 [Pseudolabrys sp.]|nr:hypothetical protein [Pseudolabrys sp.]